MRQVLTTLFAILAVAACGPDEEANRAVGELASDRIELSAESSEPITHIAVDEGAIVAAGDVLVEQDRTRAEARLAETQAALGQAQARLDELVRGPRTEMISAARASVEGATQDLEFRDSEAKRIREIHTRGLASPDQLDRAQAALDAAQANVKLRLAELAQAEQAVKQAAARRDSARVDLERHTLRAPVAGIADSRLYELGERPTPGQPVMIVLGGAQPYARVYVPESIRVHVQAGTVARVFVDGLDEALDGRVRWVASEAAFTPYFALTERDRGRLTYVAKIDLETDGERLPDGVPVEVEFAID